MALAIDGSTPAVAVNSVAATATVTTASFTPPAGALLLVLWSADTQASVTPGAASITDNLGAHLTYTQTDWRRLSDSPPGIDGQCAAWWAVVGSSAAMTVTVTTGTATGARESSLQVIVITGQHATPIGAHGKSGSTSAASISQSFTGTASGSWGFLAACDWDAKGAETAGTGCTLLASASIGTAISYGFDRRSSADGTNGGSTAMNMTIPGTSTTLSWVYVEVVPAAAVATVDPGPLLGNGPAGFTPFRPGPPVIRWDPSGAVATQVAVDTGTAVLGAATSVTAVKVTAVTAVASGGFGATAAARKAAPATCRAPVGVTATATARKAAPATGTTPVGLAQTATGVKVCRPALTSAAGLLGSAGASKRSTPSLTGPLGLSTTGTARKVTPSTGVDVVGLAGWVVRLPGRIVSATVPLGLVATVTAVKVSTPALRATAGLVSAGSVRKVSRPALTAAAGLAGTVAAVKVARPSLAAAAGLAGTATTVKVSRPLLLGTAGIATWAVHIAAGSQAATGTNSLGLVATVTTRRVTPAVARAQVGFAGAATARHVGKATAVTPVALSAWWAVTAPTSRGQVDALDRPTSSVAALNRSAGSVDAFDRTASRVGGG